MSDALQREAQAFDQLIVVASWSEVMGVIRLKRAFDAGYYSEFRASPPDCAEDERVCVLRRNSRPPP